MREYIDGATAIVRGALDAGCNFFAGYPISPATPILLSMIRELPKVNAIAIEAEDEIGALSMCIGAAMTGARVLTATSGPGLSLYSENIGMAIMAEVPLVIVDTQRMGPATGGATTVAQGDIQFVRWGNSGGYPIIALSPAGVAEAYSLTRRAFDLAERFRVPVFLMTDKELVMSMTTVEIAAYEYPPVRPRPLAAGLPAGTSGLRPEETFLPWRFDPIDQPPPYSPIGGEHVVRLTGSSHDEHGMLTKDPAKVARLNEHLWCKIEDHAAELESVTLDQDPEAATLWIAYGITARAMQEAAAVVRGQGQQITTLAVQSLWPVPERSLVEAVFGASGPGAVRRIVVAEMNQGQYRREVERVVYGWAARNRRIAPEIIGIHRVDGELIAPEAFIATLETKEEA
ncbi:MAG TPA: pyruvate flavodoxin/ferredoxin oxidoreductase [Anaerolineae bacterium]